MKKKLFFMIPLQVFLFLSCTTVTSTYYKDTSSLTVRAEGAVVMLDSFHKASENDIIYDGRFHLISRDKVEPSDSENAVYLVQWSGNLRYKDASYPAFVQYRQSNNNYQSIISIDILKSPPMYTFEKMEFRDFDYFGQKESSSISPEQMPHDVAAFKINGRDFILQIAYFESRTLGKNPESHVLSLISDKSQVFYILDTRGTVYAEFTENSFKIYDSGTDIDDDIWPAIAMFGLVQEICIDRNILM